MSFQDSNQQPFPPPRPDWGRPAAPGQPPQPQQPPQQSWGQPDPQGQPGQQPPQQGWAQQGQQGYQGQQQSVTQGSWGAPDQAPVPGAPGQGQGQGQSSWGWGSQQPQTPPAAGHGFGQGPGWPGQNFGQSQDHPAQGYPQQSSQGPIPQPQGYYASGGFASGSGGYYPQQSDFGSGVGYGPGYPAGPPPQSRLATVALWLGIFGGWGLINLVISILAINETGPGKKAGRGKALTGLYLTLVWIVIWIGVFVAVAGHAKTLAPGAAPSAAPKNLFTSAASPGTTGIVYLTGATDPGCVTVQNAFDAMEASKTSGASVMSFVSALQAGASRSRVAGSQIGTVAAEWSKIGTVSQTQMFTDMQAMQTACGMTLTTTDPR